MRTKMIVVLLASAMAACTTPGKPLADRGVESVNQPVLNRATYVVDLAAPGGILAPGEVARLDGWFRSLNLGYGDSIYVDGDYSETARAQVAEVAGTYGMMVLQTAPVTAGLVQPGTVRVVVSRTRAEVPGCPNWSVPSQPNFENRSMSNFGCGVNSNLAAMVANPEDLIHGQEGTGVDDTSTGAKAIMLYRQAEPTGKNPSKKTLPETNTKKDSQ